jgi:uncharacterized membrane protein YraQ (UPF0718 family)
MDIFTLGLWVIAIVLLIISLIKDKNKTFGSLKKAKSMMGGMAGSIFGILLLIGLILAFIPPSYIESVLGSANEVMGTFIGAIIGAITLIPAFVAFPLAGSFVDAGASLVTAAAFVTTLTMVGFVTFPLEKEQFGAKFAFWRNALSFVFAIIIALGMGLVL